MILLIIENIFIYENYFNSIIALIKVKVKSYFERDICHKKKRGGLWGKLIGDEIRRLKRKKHFNISWLNI